MVSLENMPANNKTAADALSHCCLGNMAGMSISLSAVIQWTNDKQLKDRVTDEVLSGKKKVSR